MMENSPDLDPIDTHPLLADELYNGLEILFPKTLNRIILRRRRFLKNCFVNSQVTFCLYIVCCTFIPDICLFFYTDKILGYKILQSGLIGKWPKNGKKLQYSKMGLKPIQKWKTLKAKEIASFLEYVGLIKEFLSFVPKYGNFWKKWALRVPKRKC